MSVLVSETGVLSEPEEGQQRLSAARAPLWNLAAVGTYLLAAVYVTLRLWRDVDHRVQSSNVQDHGFFEFVLAHAAHSALNLENPLFSHQLNVPDGVNMMANTSILGLALPLVPVTVLLGVNTAYAVLIVFALASTATAWYYVLSQHVGAARPAAFIGAALCGFGPAAVSQSNGHPNLACQFMVPLILAQVAALRSTDRPVRRGAVLGLMITYQMFINEEVLLVTVVAAALLTVVWMVSHREPVRAALRPGLVGLGIAAAVAGVLMAYPLYFQFRGPQHYGAVPATSVSYYSDLVSYVRFPTQSIVGTPFRDLGLKAHRAEENAYFGWPLLVLAMLIAVWLWRSVLVRGAVVVGVFFALLSLGRVVKVSGVDTGIPGPFALFNSLPLVESVVPVRLAIPAGAALGVLVAIGLDRVARAPHRPGDAKPLWYAAFAGALVPLLPTPLPATSVPATPPFVTAGIWRKYVGPGQSVLVVPLPAIGSVDGQRWSAQVLTDMPLANGYFLGPDRGDRRRALYTAPSRPTQQLLRRVWRTGKLTKVTETDRQRMVVDLRYWRTAAVIIGEVPKAEVLRRTVTDLLGAPQFIGGVWVWDVRPLLDS
jgi:hypothetical protein